MHLNLIQLIIIDIFACMNSLHQRRIISSMHTQFNYFANSHSKYCDTKHRGILRNGSVANTYIGTKIDQTQVYKCQCNARNNTLFRSSGLTEHFDNRKFNRANFNFFEFFWQKLFRRKIKQNVSFCSISSLRCTELVLCNSKLKEVAFSC